MASGGSRCGRNDRRRAELIAERLTHWKSTTKAEAGADAAQPQTSNRSHSRLARASASPNRASPFVVQVPVVLGEKEVIDHPTVDRPVEPEQRLLRGVDGGVRARQDPRDLRVPRSTLLIRVVGEPQDLRTVRPPGRPPEPQPPCADVRIRLRRPALGQRFGFIDTPVVAQGHDVVRSPDRGHAPDHPAASASISSRRPSVKRRRRRPTS
jgi:hypothetical protein